MKNPQKFYIKYRNNYQSQYYVPCGQLSKTAAKAHERPAHGSNVMFAYDTEAEYLARIAELKALGEHVQD